MNQKTGKITRVDLPLRPEPINREDDPPREWVHHSRLWVHQTRPRESSWARWWIPRREIQIVNRGNESTNQGQPSMHPVFILIVKRWKESIIRGYEYIKHGLAWAFRRGDGSLGERSRSSIEGMRPPNKVAILSHRQTMERVPQPGYESIDPGSVQQSSAAAEEREYT